MDNADVVIEENAVDRLREAVKAFKPRPRSDALGLPVILPHIQAAKECTVLPFFKSPHNPIV